MKNRKKVKLKLFGNTRNLCLKHGVSLSLSNINKRMCGILFYVLGDDVSSTSTPLSNFEEIIRRIRRRGPDAFRIETHTDETISVVAAAGVLWLQGSKPSIQPLKKGHSSKTLLLWNGDIFDGLQITSNDCDTDVLFEHLLTESDPLDVIKKIRGPFAFIFLQNGEELWFGRDFFGRHSLLYLLENDGGFALSSVGDFRPWKQVPADGVYKYSLRDKAITLYPWSSVRDPSLSLFSFPIQLSDRALPSPVDLTFKRDIDTPSDIISASFTEEFYTNKSVLEFYLDHEIEIVQSFEKVLTKSVRTRVECQPPYCSECVKFLNKCNHAKIGILFSGGLDSAYLAHLIDKVYPKEDAINLYNIAFGEEGQFKDVPDRITGQRALNELRSISPNRSFNFIPIDVTKSELKLQREKESIDELLKPSETVLDDSIGCALWFATRGVKGEKCKPRVLITGSGADEQLGGYSRHRAVFNRDGWPALKSEIEMEIRRISERNLGRDNRIIADHGVAPRIPFLDEKVVSFLNKVPLWKKMDLNFRRGLGEKLLLRAAAYKAGLFETASEPKRAIQFGSRIAKLENKKEKGSDRAVR